ncbi:hypothetical protein [Rhodopseudomonas sp. P2A-2r]|uniref:hypothetical protein n=1 Tax=unclassified Rhodopseudomonas TaxID=2638247 RepID=UPI002234A72A|nr:hypothetical protein [Rhodopseudomonas sp. P2A-2r]UZE51857.1 hypothetical protein ONR75_15585 [Rhodopseudomonas sp. P2A-2r]
MSSVVDEGFSYSVDLTPEDYRQLFVQIGRRQQRQTTSKRIYLVAVLAAVPVALVLGAMSTVMTRQGNGAAVAMLCALAFLLGIQAMSSAFSFTHARSLQQLASSAARDWPSASMCVDADGVRISGHQTLTEWRWPAIAEVSVEDGALLFWSGTLYAMRIPGRVFATVAERDAVHAYARSRIAPG